MTATMPQNDDFLAAVRAAFQQFDDETEVAKGLHFDARLHPRDAIGRFAPSGNTAGLGAGKPGAGNRPKPKVSKPSTGKHPGTDGHPSDKVGRTRARLRDEHGITTPEQLSTALGLDNAEGKKVRDLVTRDWGYQDGERVEVVGRPPSGASGGGHVTGWTGRKDIFRVKLDNGDTVDLPMEHLKPASKPKSVSREERVSAYREQLRSSGMPSWAREAAVSQFREDLKLDEKLRADVDKQVERTPNVSDGGFGYKRYDSVRFDNGRGLGEQRGMVVGAENDFSEPAIMVIDSEGNTQYVYPNEQKSTIGPMYAPNGFPWGDISFDQVGKSITGVFEAACAELDRARAGILKDQMMTGDVPTTVDGPASGRKRKKKGPGDCGPNGSHVAKDVQVGGYVRVLPNGKIVRVSGYSRAGADAVPAIDLERRAADPTDEKVAFHRPKRGEHHEFVLPGGGGRIKGKVVQVDGDAVVVQTPGTDSHPKGYKMRVPYTNLRAPKRETPSDRPAADAAPAKTPAKSGGKFTSVKPGETKEIDGVTVKRGKAIGSRGSTYTLSTPHIGQVVYGRKQSQAKAEHEYLVAHDGGAKKDPKYTWQADYEIGDKLADGSTVKAFWRNELIVTRPDGSKGSFSALSTLPKKK